MSLKGKERNSFHHVVYREVRTHGKLIYVSSPNNNYPDSLEYELTVLQNERVLLQTQLFSSDLSEYIFRGQ